MEYYLRYILNFEEIVEEFKAETKDFWLKEEMKSIFDKGYFFSTSQRQSWNKLSEILKITEFFGINCLDINKSNLEGWMKYLHNPIQYSGGLNSFDAITSRIKEVFMDAKKELTEKIGLLEIEEKNRLTEALNCYIQELNYSSIVMSVSAIEYRLISLMKSKYDDKNLEDLTLGQLIWEYTHNKEKYENVIPEKHEPLLDYCNIYRVFSVHPKKEKITRSIATSILCMTCNFLFDKNLKAKIAK